MNTKFFFIYSILITTHCFSMEQESAQLSSPFLSTVFLFPDPAKAIKKGVKQALNSLIDKHVFNIPTTPTTLHQKEIDAFVLESLPIFIGQNDTTIQAGTEHYKAQHKNRIIKQIKSEKKAIKPSTNNGIEELEASISDDSTTIKILMHSNEDVVF